MKKIMTKDGVDYCVMTSAEDGELFYAKLGRFFCDKAVTDEMGGYQVLDGPDRIWVVALDSRQRAIGFSSFSLRDLSKNVIHLCDSYVDPERRKNGVYKHLFECRETELMKHVEGKVTIKVIAVSASEKMLHDHGYTRTSQRGRFAYMSKVVER